MLTKPARPRDVRPLEDEEPTVFVVAVDPQIGRCVEAAIKPKHLCLREHGTARSFLKACDPRQPGCLVCESPLPGLDNGELLKQLAERRIALPVIFVAESADAATVVRAMKAGAVNYLEQPLSRRTLGEAIEEALDFDAQRRTRLRRAAAIRKRLADLTAGETEVLRMLLDGCSNRQIADLLRLSVRTIEVRRAKLMAKMRARSLPHLVRLVLCAENNG